MAHWMVDQWEEMTVVLMASQTAVKLAAQLVPLKAAHSVALTAVQMVGR